MALRDDIVLRVYDEKLEDNSHCYHLIKLFRLGRKFKELTLNERRAYGDEQGIESDSIEVLKGRPERDTRRRQ